MNPNSDSSNVDFGHEMYVVKRNGTKEIVSFDKILKRLKKLGNTEIKGGSSKLNLNYTVLVMKVIDQIYDGIPTTKIDELASEQCAVMSSHHPDYGILAGRIVVSNLKRNTLDTFSAAMRYLYLSNDVHGNHRSLLDVHIYKSVIERNGQLFDSWIDDSRDYLIDYFGFKTLEKSYLMRVGGKIIERPQYLWMRVAIGIHRNNLDLVKETYDLMSQKYFTHATPTLFNSCTPHPQLSSCYLIAMENDSIAGIYNTLKDCAEISKWAGGIGLHIHNIRASGTPIHGTNGISNGLVPMLRVFNSTARYVDQCLPGNTIIYTSTGPIPIKFCVPNQTLVLNKSGTFQKVQHVLEHTYDGNTLIQIKSKNCSETLIITPEHPIYVINTHTDKFEWVNAKDVVADKHKMTFKIPTFVEDIPSISDHDCFFYGLYLFRGDYDDLHQMRIAIHDFSDELKSFVRHYLNTRYCIQTMEDANYISWDYNNVLPFHYADFYHPGSLNQKYIHSRWLNLPRDKSIRIIDAFFVIQKINESEIYQNMMKDFILFNCFEYLFLSHGSHFYYDFGFDHDEDFSVCKGKQVVDDHGDSFICSMITSVHVQQIKKPIVLYDLQLFPSSSSSSSSSSSLLPVEDNNVDDLHLHEKKDFEDPNYNYQIQQGLVHNGGGKRNGSIAIYLEPWHADVEIWLEMKKNHGDEEMKARDLFYALWIPDLFMQRVNKNANWTLMCPHECPGLADVYGQKFVDLYEKYEREGRGKKTIEARKLWLQILDSQMETGTPYILYKDACNEKSNQKNLGTIKSSNLCTEIVEYSDNSETAVCNLASIALPAFVENKMFNFAKLIEVTRVVTRNLNSVIDINYYPTEKTRKSNLRHRPIGIGVQGLADVFIMLDMPFESADARKLNCQIFESIYYAALDESCCISQRRYNDLIHLITKEQEKEKEKDGGESIESDSESDSEEKFRQIILNNHLNWNKYDQNFVASHLVGVTSVDQIPTFIGAYSSFDGSPISAGILQFDMWGDNKPKLNPDLGWSELRERCVRYGIRNSLLVAPMPTASTSQILGYNECFEPLTSNIYSRKTLAGEFLVVNKYLMNELIQLGLWNEDVKNNIIANHGSIQQIENLSDALKQKYKIVWEMAMKNIIDMAKDRGAFICQSQSMNCWLSDPSYKQLTSMHFYSWNAGLKTGLYYLRRKAKHSAQQFTIVPKNQESSSSSTGECLMCSA